MIPLGADPSPQSVPYATFALIVANVFVYAFFTVPLGDVAANPGDPLYQAFLEAWRSALPEGVSLTAEKIRGVTAYDLFVFAHGYKPADPDFLDLFVSLFLHADFLHLLGNMLFLFVYGISVEDRVGWSRYLSLYLGMGMFATLVHSFLKFSSPLPLLGASGAVSGILGLYFIWFPRNRVRVLLLFPPFVRVVYWNSRVVLAFYFIVENLVPFLVEGITTGGGVAYGAHLGGFLAGFTIAHFTQERWRAQVEATVEASDLLPVHSEIEDLVRARKLDSAVDRYVSLKDTGVRILTARSSLALADYMRRNRRPGAALLVYQRHLRDYPAGPGVATAHIGAGSIQMSSGNLDAAYEHFVEGLKASPSPEEADTAKQGVATIEGIRTRRGLR